MTNRSTSGMHSLRPIPPLLSFGALFSLGVGVSAPTSNPSHTALPPLWEKEAPFLPHHWQLLPYESYLLLYLPLHHVSMSASRHFRLPVTSHQSRTTSHNSRGQRLEL